MARKIYTFLVTREMIETAYVSVKAESIDSAHEIALQNHDRVNWADNGEVYVHEYYITDEEDYTVELRPGLRVR